MQVFLSLDFLVVFLLIVTVASVWVPAHQSTFLLRYIPLHHWYWPFFITLGLALYSGAITLIGLGLVLLFMVLFILRIHHSQSKWITPTLTTCIIVFSLLLGFRALPGFEYVVLIEGIQYSNLSDKFTIGYGMGKYVVGLLIVGFLLPRLSSWQDWKAMLVKIVPIYVVTIVVVFTIGIVVKYVGFDVKWPAHLGLWMAINLFLACVTEEAFFRGLIQHKLTQAMSSLRYGGIVAVCLSALLFGFAHIAGGWLYVALASIAGLGYGWTFYKTQSIEAAILVHFGFNLTHIIFFTYPTLVSV